LNYNLIVKMPRIQQGLIFFCMYTGYTLYTLSRKTFSFVIPQIISTGEITQVEAGKVLSSLSLAYTIGKFVSGIVVDKLSPSLMFSFGLCSAGLINLLFAFSDPRDFMVLWFLNGIVQGPGWPACAKLMKSWYSPAKLGSMWSLLSTCMNLAASAGPLFSSWCLDGKDDSEWRIIMIVFGVASLAFSTFTYFTMKDEPNSKTTSFEDNSRGDKSKDEGEMEVESVWSSILTSSYMYVLCFAYMVCIATKGAISDWGTSYLTEEKGSTKFSSSKILAIIEVGGIIGRISSGFISDFLVSYFGKGALGHPRHIVIIVSEFFLISMLYALRVVVTDVEEQEFYALTIAFFIGFCLYGTISIVGLLAMENSTPSMSGTSHSFCALAGNIGLTCSGYHFSMFASQFSWSAGFQLAEYLITISLASFIAFQWKNCYIGPRPKTA